MLSLRHPGDICASQLTLLARKSILGPLKTGCLLKMVHQTDRPGFVPLQNQ